jgi:hypothetical protein
MQLIEYFLNKLLIISLIGEIMYRYFLYNAEKICMEFILKLTVRYLRISRQMDPLALMLG